MSAGGEPVHRAINLDEREPLRRRRAREHRVLRAAARRPTARASTSARCAAPSSSSRCSSSPGACAGCGETPYLKLLSQLFGDRLTVANATGCSSIYGANLPTTPWTVDADGRGPGVVELAVRGQRRVRPRPAARGRPSHRARPPPPARSCATSSAPTLVDEILAGAAAARVRAARAARAPRRAASAASRRWTGRRSTTCAACSTT